MYEVHSTGRVDVETELRPEGDVSVLPSLPRVGLDLTLDGEYDRVSWYGRGPHESYADSKQSALLGRYDTTMDELHTPYVRPQANGKRTDVRWLTLMDARGIGLSVTADAPFSFDAHDYATADLEEAEHRHELPHRDAVSLSLDRAHCGLGTGSLEPPTLEAYRVEPGPFAFEFTLRPFVVDGRDPTEG